MKVKELKSILEDCDDEAKVYLVMRGEFYNDEVKIVLSSSQIEPRVYLSVDDDIAKESLTWQEHMEAMSKKKE
jgi:hypothetical protein